MDFADYFNRIGLQRPQGVTRDTLAALQFAQRAAIPFENIDVLLGRGISTEPAAIFTKLVTQRRGGYCFEQNQLLAGALTELGVAHRLVLARVWLGATEMPAHTHLAVVAEMAGQAWLLDAGFGGGYCPPLPLVTGSVASDGEGARYHLHHDPGIGWILDREANGSLVRQYSFTLAEVFPADIRLCNHWTSTHKASRFTQLLVVNRVTAAGRLGLTGGDFVRVADGRSTHASITRDRLGPLLADEFGLELDPADTAALARFVEAVNA
ncbi:arylamine N-acetyltransferase family protein [Sandarakinorhabdus oryzae]|uniref:arylamine N-acetyltransferase family protein n=1 Tax=Sandarakinorhabdus oryzae TaxID=2675220 RepID=UPI0018CC4F82|nr:arylamine N-acetyltransferase [Sandarakinorhabdus oryzae]